jgi:prevent-host-death family protein
MDTLTSSEAQNHFGETLDKVIKDGLVKITRRGRQAIVMAPATEPIIRAIKSAYAVYAFRKYREDVKQDKAEPITEEELERVAQEELKRMANE